MFASTLHFVSPFLTPSSKKRRNPFSSQENESSSSLSSSFSPYILHQVQAMEKQDWNMIAADCLVLSCCCQCLILQLLAFVLLKLPSKLIKKTKHYMKRKFGNKVRNGGKMMRVKVVRCAEDVVGCQKPGDTIRSRAQAESFPVDGFGGCLEEVEEVLEELSTKGEFGFGSFWRGDDGVEVHFPICLVKQELGCQ